MYIPNLTLTRYPSIELEQRCL